jgi:hypothetical protein
MTTLVPFSSLPREDMDAVISVLRSWESEGRYGMELAPPAKKNMVSTYHEKRLDEGTNTFEFLNSGSSTFKYHKSHHQLLNLTMKR